MDEAKSSSVVDIVKWFVALALVAVAAGINIVFADESLLYRVLGIVAIALVAIFVALQTAKGAKFSELVKQARIEIRKVVWPSHQETTQTTLLVLVVVVLAAILLWALDSLFGKLASLVIG